MEKPTPLPDDMRFAVKFLKNHPTAPDGWPDEKIELRPEMPARPPNPKNGYPGNPVFPAENMREKLEALGYSKEAIKSFREMTGAEINAVVDSLWSKHEPVLDEIEAKKTRELEYQKSDVEVHRQLCDGFEWPAGSGQRFSLSHAAQHNLARKAALANLNKDSALAFPMTFSTTDHKSVEIKTQDEFTSFLRAADAAIDAALAEGRDRKSKL